MANTKKARWTIVGMFSVGSCTITTAMPPESSLSRGFSTLHRIRRARVTNNYTGCRSDVRRNGHLRAAWQVCTLDLPP